MRCDVKSNVLPTPCMRLFHSASKCRKFLEKKGVPFHPLKLSDAQTWFITNDTDAYAVVLYEAKLSMPFEYDVSILAHEATHIAIFNLESIGEDSPTEEERCYMVQAIVHELVTAHFKWKEKKISLLNSKKNNSE